MRTARKPPLDDSTVPGFTLPAILVVAGAMLILAVGILLISSIERHTARSFADRERAELAASAGLEDVRSILNLEAANDEFIILPSKLAKPISPDRNAAQQLFLARGQIDGTSINFRYVPLFSALATPATSPTLAPPPVEPLVGASNREWLDFTTLPYLEKVRAAWLPVHDEQGRTVARYAYWVEDLQGRIDPASAGNLDGPDSTHCRESYPFPAPGVDDALTGAPNQRPLNQVALHAIDPAATETTQTPLAKTIIEQRRLLVSPESLTAAASIAPPLHRDLNGHLTDPKARAVEENLVSGLVAYDEQPIIPFGTGIDPSMSGKPKRNLNRIVSEGGKTAVEATAEFIQSTFPTFEDRKGGFPENYLKTLVANAIDYADENDRPTLSEGEFRGIDSYPLTTELALKVKYINKTVVDGRQFLNFNLKLFAELYNPTDLEVSGSARLSYEVALKVDSIGSGTGSPAFDSAELLDNPTFSTHDLEKIAGDYWSKERDVALQPGEYRCYLFATVDYHIDQETVASNPISNTTPFSLREDRGEKGSALMWNDEIVERQTGVVRQQGLIYGVSSSGKKTGGYLVGTPSTLTKSHLPGLLYQKLNSSDFYGNTGDPRISHYMNRSRNSPLDENAYPQNASPNRRSIRLNIYKDDAAEKPKVYARTLPSEWPDGGHDAPVGAWTPGSNDTTEMTDPRFDFPYESDCRYTAIQRISNRGFYYSTTELGRLFDPVMYKPAFTNASDTSLFLASSKMPAGKASWPDAKSGQGSALYGGGNTLRIGRPEHPAFDQTDGTENRAIGLLDLFHTGQPASSDPALRTGPVVRIDGNVNVNTASRDALRAIAAGPLTMDPKLSKITASAHAGAPTMAPPVEELKLDAPKNDLLADRIADALIAGRPYASPSRVALAKDPEGNEVFGNRMIYPDQEDIQWTDAAAEEIFARVYQSITVRSRNFRVWVVAQAVGPAASPSSATEILSEVRKVYTLVTDPGERSAEGAIVPGKTRTRVLNARDF